MSFLASKVAIVTGGASGLGLAMVKKLLQNKVKGVAIVDVSEEAGNKVLCDIQKNCEDKDRVIFLKTDVTKDRDFEDAFIETICKFKHLDIVINNAGVLNELQWQKTVAINFEAVLRGTFLAMDKYLPQNKSDNEGVVLNVASILGIDIMETLPTYTAAKHGVVGLGKALGTECLYRKNNVRLLTLCPGVVATPLVDPNAKILVKDIQGFRAEHKKLSKMACSADYIGDSAVKIINEGKHGSVWVAEDEEEPYEVVFPNRICLRKPSC